MGERLERVDTLRQQGITPIPPDVGISMLHHLMRQSLPVTSLVISGRLGEPLTLKLEQPELPFLRFLETPRVYYPGVELVVDVTLSTETDPYLNDHVFQGERIFPGVMGLEAIAQVVIALFAPRKRGIELEYCFELVKFNHIIVFSVNEPLKVRIAALITESGKIKAVLRSEQTGFSVDHFEAVCVQLTESPPFKNGELPVPSLYSELLFHQGRFQRIKGYSHLKATECVAEIKTDTVTPWFSRLFARRLILRSSWGERCGNPCLASLCSPGNHFIHRHRTTGDSQGNLC